MTSPSSRALPVKTASISLNSCCTSALGGVLVDHGTLPYTLSEQAFSVQNRFDSSKVFFNHNLFVELSRYLFPPSQTHFMSF